MKQLIFICLYLCTFAIALANNWDIAEIYEVRDAPYKAKAINEYGNIITSYGSATSIGKLLVPTKINEGRYKITIIEVDKGFFRIKDTDLYIEMKGTNYLGPTSIINKSAEVILINEGLFRRIEYN